MSESPEDCYDLESDDETCQACGGDGYIHDCGEDTCCCADPDEKGQQYTRRGKPSSVLCHGQAGFIELLPLLGLALLLSVGLLSHVVETGRINADESRTGFSVSKVFVVTKPERGFLLFPKTIKVSNSAVNKQWPLPGLHAWPVLGVDANILVWSAESTSRESEAAGGDNAADHMPLGQIWFGLNRAFDDQRLRNLDESSRQASGVGQFNDHRQRLIGQPFQPDVLDGKMRPLDSTRGAQRQLVNLVFFPRDPANSEGQQESGKRQQRLRSRVTGLRDCGVYFGLPQGVIWLLAAGLGAGVAGGVCLVAALRRRRYVLASGCVAAVCWCGLLVHDWVLATHCI